MEKTKLSRTGKSDNASDLHQSMTVLINDTIRGIVRAVNEENIKKENIVSLLKENGQFILVYFR